MEFLPTSFEEYIAQLVEKNRHRRIYRFQYQGKHYWLKQPEQLRGIWKLLKPNAQIALQKEIQTLKYFVSRQAPVPQLITYGEHFFVVEDAGRTAIAWQEDSRLSQQRKLQILLDCLHALVQLHQTGLVHGRPVLRDMTWQDGKVTFIDLEAYPTEKDLLRKKTKDVILFLYGLCRAKVISDEQIQCLIREYAELGDDQVWHEVLSTLRRYRFIYYILLPFKPIAKTDLIAIYRLFENMSFQLKEGK
ncbi:RIO1 family regulatory kinase/ATPase [Bisgaard Taxon 45]